MATCDGPKLASWPEPEVALQAILDALGVHAAVKSRIVLSSDERTEAAEAKDFERFLAGRHVHRTAGDRLLVLTLDSILREVSGHGLDDISGIRQSVIDLEDRYLALRVHVPTMWASQDAVDWFVLSRLLVPWAGGLAAGCVSRGLPLDAGMPGGQFWFLPERRGDRVIQPMKFFFDWWRDLAGYSSQKDFSIRLEEVTQGYGAAPWAELQSEIADWVSAKPDVPSLATIDRIASAARAIGRAADCEPLVEGGTLFERLSACVTFARGRNLDPDRLASEIPTSPDAIAEIMAAVDGRRTPRLSTDVAERFVHHMHRRWAVPTGTEIRSRLILARGGKTLFRRWRARFGEEKALGLCAQFRAAYNVFMDLLKREPHEAEERLDRIVADPGMHRLLGILQPAGSPDFIDAAAAFMMGCPDRFECDTMPVTGMGEHELAVQLVKGDFLRLVDLSRELMLPVPARLAKACNLLELEGLRADLERLREQALLLFGVLGKDSLGAMWAAYVRLPEGLPPSAVHVRVAQKIVDTVTDLDEQPVWSARFAIALCQATDQGLGPALQSMGLLLEGWWLTAPHRRKRTGDLERARLVLAHLSEIESRLNGWLRYERIWRTARLLAQSGDLRGAMKSYEEILRNGSSNISSRMDEIAWEALAVSAKAGKAGKFTTMVKLARGFDQRLVMYREAALRKRAVEAFTTEFCFPYVSASSL